MKGVAMRFIKRGYPMDHNSFSKLEAAMEDAFQPVVPRPEFVRRLRREIATQYYAIQEQAVAERQKQALLISAGLFGVVLTLLMGIRIAASLIAMLVLLFQWRRPSAIRLAAPVQLRK